MKARSFVLPVLGLLAISVLLLAPAVFLWVVRETGPRAQATVGDCVTTGTGRWAQTNCTGTWIVGGSLLENGHVIYGTVNGVDESDVGKTIDVSLNGGTAYSRASVVPIVLAGFSLLALVLAGILFFGRTRLTRPN